MSFNREEVAYLKVIGAKVGMVSCIMHFIAGLILMITHSLTAFLVGSLCGISAGAAIATIMMAESLGDKK